MKRVVIITLLLVSGSRVQGPPKLEKLEFVQVFAAIKVKLNKKKKISRQEYLVFFANFKSTYGSVDVNKDGEILQDLKRVVFSWIDRYHDIATDLGEYKMLDTMGMDTEIESRFPRGEPKFSMLEKPQSLYELIGDYLEQGENESESQPVSVLPAVDQPEEEKGEKDTSPQSVVRELPPSIPKKNSQLRRTQSYDMSNLGGKTVYTFSPSSSPATPSFRLKEGKYKKKHQRSQSYFIGGNSKMES